jgi:predicted transposase
MLQTFEIKLIMNKDHSNILRETFKEFNSDCNFISEYAFKHKEYNKYYRLKENEFCFIAK